MESIRAAAIKCFFTNPDRKPIILTGSSHGEIISGFVDLVESPAELDREHSEQGFMTSLGRFVDRFEAYRIAGEADQLIRSRVDGVLYSEYVTYR